MGPAKTSCGQAKSEQLQCCSNINVFQEKLENFAGPLSLVCSLGKCSFMGTSGVCGDRKSQSDSKKEHGVSGVPTRPSLTGRY